MYYSKDLKKGIWSDNPQILLIILLIKKCAYKH